MSYLPSSPFRLTIAVWQSKMKDLFQAPISYYYRMWAFSKMNTMCNFRAMNEFYLPLFMSVYVSKVFLPKNIILKKIKAIYVALDHFWSFRCSVYQNCLSRRGENDILRLLATYLGMVCQIIKPINKTWKQLEENWIPLDNWYMCRPGRNKYSV